MERIPQEDRQGQGLKAFRSALKRASFEDILAGVIAYRNDPTRNPDYTKYPTTWLNADAWENAAALPEVRQAAEEKRAKEVQRTKAFLQEQAELEKKAVPLTPELKKRLGL